MSVCAHQPGRITCPQCRAEIRLPISEQRMESLKQLENAAEHVDKMEWSFLEAKREHDRTVEWLQRTEKAYKEAKQSYEMTRKNAQQLNPLLLSPRNYEIDGE